MEPLTSGGSERRNGSGGADTINADSSLSPFSPASAPSVSARQRIGARSRELGRLFCKNSSLRGVSKVAHSATGFLRALWLVFVLMMFLLLLYSSGRIISNYWDYDVAIQTSMLFNNASAFPTVTLCSHYPFSHNAHTLWRRGGVLSPSAFNRMLRNLTGELLLGNSDYLAHKLTQYDKLSVYYQNLEPEMAKAMGHKASELLLHCLIIHGSYSFVGKAKDCGLSFSLVSSPRYFNCYSVSPITDSRQVSAMYLILRLNTPKKSSPDEEAFIMDVFDQATGLRLLLHEAGVYPDVERSGVHVEPGKMTEIAFDTVFWNEANDSPNDRCQQDDLPTINDLGVNYTYSYAACIDQQLNKRIIAQCGCILSRLPRPVVRPTDRLPYCGRIDYNSTSAFFNRLYCLEQLNVGSIRQGADGTVCRKRCQRLLYEQAASITRWRYSDFQLRWLLNQSHSWAALLRATALGDAAERAQMRRRVLAYARANSLRDGPGSGLAASVAADPKTDDNNDDDDEQFAFVVIRRKSQDTIQKEEKLTVTFEALVSRIGGLCSLYLGLTMAFFVELLEFAYLSFLHLRDRFSGGGV